MTATLTDNRGYRATRQDREQVLARAHDLGPLIRQHAPQAEQQRRLAPEVTDGLRRSGAPVTLDLDLLDAFEVAKEAYEFVYAATVLPSWLWAPREGMRWLLARGDAV